MLNFLLSRKRRALSEAARYHHILEPEKIMPQIPYWKGPSPVIHISTNLLKMQGAHSFISKSHPFLLALEQGELGISKFYDSFRPKDISEMYNIPRNGLEGENLAPWELPWLLQKRKHPRGEGGLSESDGVSYFGPCSKEKIAFEVRTLVRLLESIQREGYQPDVHGHIEGHFLQSDNSVSFFVRGGKHRAAVLAYLGYERIPVRMRDTWPRVIYRDTARFWPLVSSGAMDIEIAMKIFDRYTQTPCN